MGQYILTLKMGTDDEGINIDAEVRASLDSIAEMVAVVSALESETKKMEVRIINEIVK